MLWKHAARACALLSAPICLLGAVSVASASADEDTDVSHIVGPDVVLGELGRAGPDKPIVKHVNVTKDTKTFLAAWVVYNKKTCKEVDEGAWTVQVEPKKGDFSTGSITGHLSSGACPKDTFTFAAIYYTWTAKTGKTDTGTATWKGTHCKTNCTEAYQFIFHLES